MGLFESVLSDTKVQNEYNKYKEVENDYDATHDMRHVLGVIEICKKVCKLFNLNRQQTDDIKIAALLHDICVADEGKTDHAERSYLWAKEYLADKALNDDSKTQILKAIRHHSKGTNTLYGRVLTFADKLDINEKRILPRGLSERGVRQYACIKTVDINIKNDTLIVKFKTNGKIDIPEMNEYYFTAKIFDAVDKLANFFRLKSQIYIDNNEWKIK